MVKTKSGRLQIFTALPGSFGAWFLPVISLLTFIFSWISLYPSALVERWYAELLFPRISQFAAHIADAISISWLDLLIPVGVVSVVILGRKRRWLLLLNMVAVLYLIFFWTWGLNYHRKPLAS